MIEEIAGNICYTELVYGRVNKKLKVDLSSNEIEEMVMEILKDHQSIIEKIGKNFYISNLEKHVRLTVNSYNYRLITANRI
ncbi:DUF3781 domain-containing protein [Companilactobacillus mishanensis]|uniref:DUF3781 domain-containing protein n=1 Tax=Companilactobacillus mishanensis TaxID=2486008 RepID=A0A5P0ZHU9_9LACO|nr:DUF3781 domain-containing protein [Companilactobacillus mishanensis]MQS52641.1 DUF3781 domain-containing protein [Companilactobacillus mishanensis]